MRKMQMFIFTENIFVIKKRNKRIISMKFSNQLRLFIFHYHKRDYYVILFFWRGKFLQKQISYKKLTTLYKLYRISWIVITWSIPGLARQLLPGTYQDKLDSYYLEHTRTSWIVVTWNIPGPAGKDKLEIRNEMKKGQINLKKKKNT